MISPQPFFEARGAPFCVYQHIRALLELGYEVDLVTYPIGKDINLPGLTIYRAAKIPFIKSVKPGPSLAKFPLDIAVFFTTFWRLCLRRYSFIHAHEEAGFMGVMLGFLFRAKNIYYMHCNLPELVVCSNFTRNALLLRSVQFVQNVMLRKADGVIAFYPQVAKTAQALAPNTLVELIVSPAVDEEIPAPTSEEVEALRQQLQLGNGPVIVYTGTLENYQGIDILLESAVEVRKHFPTIHYVIAGGKPEQVAALKDLAHKLDLDETTRFVGQRPLEEMPCYMAMATMLVSPRNKGTHAPLKLYTYMRSGKPILATDILSNTQILTPDIAKIVSASAEGLAQGTLLLLQEPAVARQFAQRSKEVFEEQYSWPVFLQRNKVTYDKFAALAKD
jgi:glycosyltransferase involved in cell wall biosynthesis